MTYLYRACLLPIDYCLLPIACCLLPLGDCLLPIAYYLSPLACAESDDLQITIDTRLQHLGKATFIGVQNLS